MSEIGTRMKKRRLEKGLSLKQISLRAGVPVSTYREWEYGRKIIGEPYLQLSLALEMSLFELITGRKPQKRGILAKLDEINLICRDLKESLESLD